MNFVLIPMLDERDLAGRARQSCEEMRHKPKAKQNAMVALKQTDMDNGEVNALINSPSAGYPSSSPTHIHSNALNIQRIAKLSCTVLLFTCTSYLLHYPIDPSPLHSSPLSNAEPNSKGIYIFGHSTGHSGTGTFHKSLQNTRGCLWNTTIGEFEYLAKGERRWRYDTDCSLVKERLIPHLVESGNASVAYVDLGELWNSTLICCYLLQMRM